MKTKDTNYKGLLIATDYRGYYCVDSTGFIYNYAVNGYGNCSIGSIPYFIKLLKSNINDFKLTSEGLELLKQYDSCSFGFSCLACKKHNKNNNCIINKLSRGI